MLATWSAATRLPRGRYGHAVVATPDGRIYVLGGSRGTSTDETSMEGAQSAVVDVFVPDP